MSIRETLKNHAQQLLSALWDAPPERYTLMQDPPAPKYDYTHTAAVAEVLVLFGAALDE